MMLKNPEAICSRRTGHAADLSKHHEVDLTGAALKKAILCEADLRANPMG